MAAPSTPQPICSICYDHFNPTVEDLQSISVCGHVFHELCIQQWLEYCPAGKKPTCPVCKQKYAPKDLVRLYFQSLGDSGESGQVFSSQRSVSGVESEAVRVDVRRIEERLLVVSAAFDEQKKRIRELDEEILLWKERATKEEALKEAIQKEKDAISKLLQAKREEVSTTSTECARLRERSLALAKELAALKLATDVNLGEEDILKFASVGNGSHVNVDTLKMSLVARNKSYKELMTQCNHLGRAESRALKKLEKAEEKIMKLKQRLQETEKQIEENDNKMLRKRLKVSKRATMKDSAIEGLVRCSNLQTDINTYEMQLEHTTKFADELTDRERNSLNIPKASVCLDTAKDDAVCIDLEDDSFFTTNGVRGETLVNFSDRSAPVRENHNHLQKDVPTQSSAEKREKVSNQQPFIIDDNVFNVEDDHDVLEDVTNRFVSKPTSFVVDMEDKAVPPIRKESSAHVNSLPGSSTSYGGMLGSEGGQRYPGKWCKRGPTAVPPTSQTKTESLISVGADGRGGKVKVLRAPERCMDKTQQPLKRYKPDTKQLGVSNGCLQIEHFFTKK